MADQKYNILLTASDQTKAAFDTAKRNINDVSESILSLQNLAISAGVASIAAFAKSSIDAGDEMFVLSQKTGIAVENLAGLQLAAKMNGASLEDVAVGVKKLSTYLFDAEAGGKAQITMLHLLGVTAKEPLPAMEQLADKFASMNDGAEKSALAVKLFGKSGLDMIPMLNGGSAALREMIEEGKRLNPITAEFAAQSNAFNDNLDRMQTKAKGNAFIFSNELLPALNDISVAVLKSSGNSEAFAAAGSEVAIVMKGVAIAIGTVINEVHTIGDAFGGMAAQLVALAHGDFEAVSNIQKAMEENRSKEALSYSEFVGHIIDGQEKIKAAAAVPGKSDSIAKQLQAAEVAQKILEAAKKTDAEMLSSHEDSFTRWVSKWKETEDELTKLGAAGAEARKVHESVYTVIVNAETQKRIDAAAKEATAKASHLAIELTKENEYFAKIHAMAQDATTSSIGREKLRYDREVIDLQKRRALAVKDHQLSLAEDAAFHQAELDLETDHQAKLITLKDDSDRTMVEGEIRWKQISMDSMSAAFGSMKGLMNSHSRAAFEIGKASAISETIINTYKSATASYAAMASIPYVGPALGAAAAAAAIVTGLAQVSAIQSSSFGGGGAGGGSYGGANSSTNGGQATSNYPSVPAAPAQTGVAAQPTTVINLTVAGAAANPDAPSLSYNTFVNDIIPLMQAAKDNGHLVDFNLVAG